VSISCLTNEAATLREAALIHQTAIKRRHLTVVACALALSVAIPWPKASADNSTPSKTPPSYIEADRSDADQVLGSALTDNVFSDRFTALRKQLVATSLRGNPALGCPEPPVFTLEVVSPEKPTSEGSAWEETYAISCKERVRRTFLLFLSVKEGMKHIELAQGTRWPTRSCNGTSFRVRRPRP
jgi:hypothetical protein